MLNLGGIANVTWLPAGGAPDDVVAFDVGPANALLDAVVQTASGGAERFDRDGARARAAASNAALLAELLDDPFLRRAAAEVHGPRALRPRRGGGARRRARRAGLAADDLLATLVAFTRRGGGARLPRLPARRAPSASDRRRRRRAQPGADGGARGALPGVPVEPMDAHGVPAAAAEAMAFSLLGRNALLGLPNHLPRCTGAARAARARRDRAGRGRTGRR